MWYRIPISEITKKLQTNIKEGLPDSKARTRLEKYGSNILPRGKKIAWWQFLLRQFRSPLVYILVFGALLTIWLGEWIDTGVILLAVVVNVTVGFWQEFRSRNILEKLQEIIRVKATVVRGGVTQELDATELVPGDLIILKSGDKVPADARLIDSEDLETNEAILTGESTPVKKSSGLIKKEVPLGDRANTVHLGTTIEKGDAQALVVATGAQTEIGKIALLTHEAEDLPTPLQERVGKLGKLISIFVGVSAVIIFVLGIIERHSLREMATTAIAVAVAAIPEGLPAAISIILAVSAQRILAKRGVVKRLVSAETLGSTSVICTDKTGTLTEGKMRVEKLVTEGDEGQLREILALANEAIIEETAEGLIIKGDSTDKAKMQAYIHAGGNLDKLLKEKPRVKIVPFDPERRFVASIHNLDNGKGQAIFVSGAPEILLDLSAQLTEENKLRLKETFEQLANQGYRVIALAQRQMAETIKDLGKRKIQDVEKLIDNLTFEGFVAIRDPIREDVKASIKRAREAGVKTIMLTGDHKLTAVAIGKELGFSTKPKAVLEGAELEEMSDDVLTKRIKDLEILSRVNPRHKIRIIRSLQKHGYVVAMTGDGVNDAPALKSADIGVALGSGTDVAKEASDLILLSNSFTVIVSAIRQGRIAFDNIRKVTVFLLAGSFTELILIFSSLILRIPLPITAVQILWTNLVEDALPNVALSFEPGEKDVMKRPPISEKESILDTESKVIIFVVGIITDIILVTLFLWLYYFSSLDLTHIRTFVFAALGLDTFFYVYSIKSLREPIFRYDIFNNRYLILATIAGLALMFSAIYLPFLNSVLGTTPLSLANWAVILILGVLEIVGVEAAKWWFLRKRALGSTIASTV